MKNERINLTPEDKMNFENFLDLCERYKYSYFWNDNGNASQRSYIENRDFMHYKTEINGVTYEIHFEVELSRKNVYVTKEVYKQGVKTTARVISTLLRKYNEQQI